ncbi:MAG: 30S ribosomal protein S6 [Candidatus Magasanikbacteria bacterium]|nr:30S ribosomal protein S6 [Candidatus Magasanikbacteria bacterium]
MQNYELLCVLPGTLTEEEVKPVIENVKEILSKSGIENMTVQNLGKSRLAYPIKHIRYGYFQIIQFEAKGGEFADVRKKLNEVRELLRAIITKFDAKVRTERERKAGGPKTSMETLSKIDRDAPKERPRNNRRERSKTPVAIKKEAEKIDLKEIDKNLDKILESDLEKV